MGSEVKLKVLRNHKRGIHTKVLAGQFRPTDIDRNSVLSFGKGIKQLQDLQRSREDMQSIFQTPVSSVSTGGPQFHRRHNSTVDGSQPQPPYKLKIKHTPNVNLNPLNLMEECQTQEEAVKGMLTQRSKLAPISLA